MLGGDTTAVTGCGLYPNLDENTMHNALPQDSVQGLHSLILITLNFQDIWKEADGEVAWSSMGPGKAERTVMASTSLRLQMVPMECTDRPIVMTSRGADWG